VDGLVDHPTVFDIAAIKDDFEKATIEAVLKCSGSPHKPTIPTRQVANVVWGGALLSDVLGRVGTRDEAAFLWSFGLDRGEFFGHRADTYVKDMPLSRLQRGDVMLAYELNGEPLSLANGFPLRLVIPGYYGTNNVKWLKRLTLAPERAKDLFTTTFYNEPMPVWEVAPESMIVTPAKNSRLSNGAIEIWGWSWSDCEIRQVEVSADNGKSWETASLEPQHQKSWQRFSHSFRIDKPGQLKLVCRATDVEGRVQPERDARNRYHSLSIEVTDR
jgi:DMSO/TMAO reductase YedYZ molybdopterin-dependent catalytic subunit